MSNISFFPPIYLTPPIPKSTLTMFVCKIILFNTECQAHRPTVVPFWPNSSRMQPMELKSKHLAVVCYYHCLTLIDYALLIALFSYETEFRKKAEKHSQRIQHGKKGRGEQLWPSYICLSTFYNPSPKWKVEMITQETNPVYWACTHCLTLEPWTVISLMSHVNKT